MATENRKIQLETALDTTGAKSGFQEIKEAGRDMAQSVAQSGQQASQGLDGVGEGAKRAADSFTREESRLRASIRRATFDLETLGKTSSQKFQAKLELQGLDASKFEGDLQRLREAETRVKSLSASAIELRAATANAVDFSKVTTSLGAQPYVQQLRDATTQTKALTDATRELNAARTSTGAARSSALDMSRVTTSFGATSFSKPLGNPSTSLGATNFGAKAPSSGLWSWLGMGGDAEAAGNAASQSLQKVTVSAGQTRAALAQLPAQFSDIVVSLQGGQRPLSVFLQQGSQIKDSFGGIGPAARALGGYVLGLVTPFTVAAAAAGALALAYFQGAKETENYNKALILTGNYLGATVSQMQTYAQAVSSVVGTQGKAAEALTALATSGKVATDSFTSVGTAVVLMNRVLGTSVEDAVSTFTKLSDEPSKASAKLNESLHYLTLATYERIRSLEEQGDKEGAAALAQKSLADATTARLKAVEAGAGSLERAWRALSDGAKAAWDAMLGIGRGQSIGDRLSQAQQNLAEYQKNVANNPVYGRVFGAAGQKYQQDVVELSRRALRETENAFAEGERTRTQSAKIAASDRLKTLSDEVKTNAEKRKKAIEELNRDFTTLGKPLSGSEYDRLVANINDKYKDPKGAAPKAFTDDAATRLLEQLRQQEASLKEQLSTSDKLTTAQKEQSKYLQLFVDLKDKKQLTAEQKSLLANQDAIKTQLAANVELEKQVKLKEEAAKLDEKRKKDAEEFERQINGINISIASSAESRRDQQDRSLEAFGLGDRARQEVDAQRTIRREYEAYKRQLTKDAAEKNQLGSDAYKAEIEKIQESLDKALSSQQAYFDALRDKRADWQNGATTALTNFIDEVDDAAKRAQEVTSNSLSGITDGITGLFTGDKGSSIKDAGKRVGQLIARGIVEQQITRPIAEWLQGSLKDSESIVGKLLGGLTSNKGTGENWLGGLLGTGGKSGKGSDPLGDFMKSKGLLGDSANVAANSALATSATAATTAITALAAAATTAAASMAGSSLGSALGAANAVGASGGDSLGALIGLMGWSDGGWTGPGAKYEPKGIVHADEFVLNKRATNAIGPTGRAYLDALNRRGYAEGGLVGDLQSGMADWQMGGRPVTVSNVFYLNQPASRETQSQVAQRAGQATSEAIRRNS